MSDVTVVGVFRNDDAARTALRGLEDAGFPPDRVGVVANNVRQAREVAGSFSPTGALIGAGVGALVGLGFALAVNTAGSQGVAVGFAMVLFAIVGAFIGMLVGRAKALKPRDYEKYESAIDRGDALVTIRCGSGEEGPARQALERVGATGVRVEGTVETV
jgi:hypothetical protein